VTGPAESSQPPQPGGWTSDERHFLRATFRQPDAPDTWTADAVYPADSPVPYTLTAKAETLLGPDGCPTPLLQNGHACGICTDSRRARSGPSAQPRTYVTEISLPPSDDGIQRLRSRMLEPGPEPEAGL
jgi:hypothetical protein